MRSITLRLGVAILTFVAGLIVSWLFSASPRIDATSHAYPVIHPQMDRRDSEVFVSDCRRTDKTIDSAITSEITFTMVGGMGSDCSSIVFRRGVSNRFGDASVTATYSSSREEWRGKLAARHYNNLLTLIEAQDYFCMRNVYSMGLVDSPIIVIGVTIGEQHKLIKATSEAVPLELVSISEAIDRVRGKVRWSRAPLKLQDNGMELAR